MQCISLANSDLRPQTVLDLTLHCNTFIVHSDIRRFAKFRIDGRVKFARAFVFEDGRLSEYATGCEKLADGGEKWAMRVRFDGFIPKIERNVTEIPD